LSPGTPPAGYERLRGKPRWVGLHVIWWGGDDWQFTNCVNCGESLRSARAVKNGYGPSCAKTSGIESLVRRTLTEERRRARDAISEKAPVQPHNRRTRRKQQKRNRPSTTPQLALLRKLAKERGVPVRSPATSREASRQIERLLHEPKK